MSFDNAGPADIPSWYCPYKIPPEFLGSIPPLVYLMGLNIEKNQVHKGIWEMIKHKPSSKDFQPTYVDVSLDHLFPPKKPRMEHLETHMPRGILRSNWLNKHLQKIPSVVVIFFDINWTDPYWNDKKSECARYIREIKADVVSHGSQVLVMLIKTPDAGEDNFSTDRASALCAAADIPPKALYILAHTHIERIQACVQRLEVGMKEASKIYYAQRIRRVKNWKDKTIDMAMLARYNFKIAFFQEIRRDYVSALSHYHAAFDMLRSITPMHSLVQELRCVAAWVSYRICRLNLLKMDFKEADKHFEKHIRTFKSLEGHGSLIFEQMAWLQNQFSQFGELLRHFYRAACTTLDPVTYFLTAVKYSERRAYMARQIKKERESIPWPEEMNQYLQSDLKIEYVGQRPWRPDEYTPDAQLVEESGAAIIALNHLEQKYKHTDDRITYLGIASDFCRDQQRMRTRCQLMMMMGIEFFAEQEYHRSVMLMMHVLRESGRDKGTMLLYLVAECGLKSAYCDGDVASYLSFLIFLLKNDFKDQVSKERRADLWSKFLAVQDKNIPPSADSCEPAVDKWTATFASGYKAYVGVHIEGIIEANFYFASDIFRAATPAEVCVVMKNQSEFSIPLSKCGAGISMSEYNCETALDCILAPGETKELSLFFTPAVKDVGKIIQVHVGYIDIGKENASVQLHYSAVTGLSPYLWSDVKKEKGKQIIAKIDPMMPLLRPKITRDDPMLVNEWHKVQVSWTNTDSFAYTKISLTYLAAAADPSDIILCADPNKSSKFGGLTHTVEAESLGPNESIDTVVYVKCMNPRRNELQLLTKAKYVNHFRQSVVNELMDPVEVIKPFEIIHRTLNLQTDACGLVMSGEDFLVTTIVKNVSKNVLHIQSLKMNKTVANAQMLPSKELKEMILREDEIVQTVATFAQLERTEVPIGKLEITWRREKEDVPCCTSEISISPVAMTDAAGIYVEGIFNRAGMGELKKPMQVKYTFHNRSSKVHDLWISLDSTESFMNAGPKRTNVKITAFESLDLTYVLFPLKTGLLKTPRIGIEFGTTGSGDQYGAEGIPSVVHKNVVTHIFVSRAEN